MSTEIPVKNAPVEQVKVQRVSVNIPQPYKEGHTLRANEADALNAHYTNSVRNSIAQDVKAKLDEMGATQSDGSVDSSKVDVKTIQKMVDDFVAGYDFGQGGGGRTGDPVEREAMEIARGLVQNAIKKKGAKPSDYSAKQITQEAKKVLEHAEHGPKIRKQAEQIVKQREQVADISL